MAGDLSWQNSDSRYRGCYQSPGAVGTPVEFGAYTTLGARTILLLADGQPSSEVAAIFIRTPKP